MNRAGFLRVLVAGCLVGPLAQPAPADDAQRLAEIRTLLREQALVVPDDSRLSALNSSDLQMGLQSIDPWAEWRPGRTEGALYAGVGADLYSVAERHWLMPYAGGPLMRAGVSDRVELHAVDGVPVAGRTTAEVARMLIGDRGDTRQLDICSPDCGVPLVLVLELEVLRPRSVEHLWSAGREIIRIRRFVGWETRSFFHSLVQSSGNRGPLLLDLRDCQGGDLFEAMDTAALFLPEGAELARIQGRHGPSRVYRAPGGDKIDAGATLLVSRHTASAGEIFAGILQAHGVARLVGERTRGKCVSQTEQVLSDGSVLSFTNLSIDLPGGVSCHQVGLTPDLVVESSLVDSLDALLASDTLGRGPTAGN